MKNINKIHKLIIEENYFKAEKLLNDPLSIINPLVRDQIRKFLNFKGEGRLSKYNDNIKLFQTRLIEEKVSPAFFNKLFIDRLYQIKINLDNEDLVSVIMPVYNGENFLKQAINSVLSQYGVNFELLIIDDGSVDASVDIALRCAEVDKRIRVIPLLRNFGCYYARNIGLRVANGSYVTTHDADDIMHPLRLSTQLNSIKKYNFSLASICRSRRWNEDFTIPLTELNFQENSLLWKRSVIDEIGYYDSVRFGGDTEFRKRLQRRFGTDVVVKIPNELNFIRKTNSGITSNEISRAYVYENSKLKLQLSDARKKYSLNFDEWQIKNKSKPSDNRKALYIEFPQKTRPFSLGDLGQNASPFLGSNVIVCIASFPDRIKSLNITILSLINQVDYIYVYLNDYTYIPDFLNHHKIIAILSKNGLGNLRDNGKFYFINQIKNSFIFTADDDLIYPEDYVSRMIEEIERHDRKVVVGVHGVIFPLNNFSLLSQRKVVHFKNESKAMFVDLLGTGTTAWHSDTLNIDLNEFKITGIADLWFSRIANIQYIPLISISRPSNWIRECENFEKSLWFEAKSNPQSYFKVYNEQLLPLLNSCSMRAIANSRIEYIYPKKILDAASILVPENSTKSLRPVIYDYGPNNEHEVLGNSTIYFEIIICGFNGDHFLYDCLNSIIKQRFGPYTYKVTIVDDGSSDKTFDMLNEMQIFPNCRIIKVNKNYGAAYARHKAIMKVTNPESVIVLVDMDDMLLNDALNTVASAYLSNKSTFITIGNWIDQNGIANSESIYTSSELQDGNFRRSILFKATHLRTFKRFLYDAIDESDFQDINNEWIKVCTDVALMFPLLDQCSSNNVSCIHKPIYMYRKMTANSTINRFGKGLKVDLLKYLREKPSKPLYKR